MNLPKISIVTPSFNQARYIESTILSVLEQDYPAVEYIIMDGGSTDGSVDIIRRYEDKLAYWVSEKDGGQTHALIEGFKRSTGDILCWLCSDDLMVGRSLWEVAEYFSANPSARAVYGDAIWIDAEGDIIRQKKEHDFNRFIWLYYYNYIPQPSTFWRRSLYEQVGGLDPAFDLSMDADLWIRFADVTDIRHVRRVWSRMRSYPAQKNERLRAESDQEDLVIRNRYLGSQPDWLRAGAKVFARSARLGLRVAHGCYW
jgi:glycosyltransferase involved in cell wall biosynthesis